MTTNGYPDPTDHDPPVEPDFCASEPVADLPVARAVEVPFARPVLSDSDRFLLLGTPRSLAWADAGLLVLCLFVLELAVGVVVAIGLAMQDTPADLQEAFSENSVDALVTELNQTMLAPMLLLRAAIAIGIIWVIVTSRRQGIASVGLPRKKWAMDSLIGVLATPVVYGLIYLVIILLWVASPALVEQMNENADRIKELVPKMPLVAFFGLSVVIGVYEELIFRGFLMSRLRRGTGSWTAAVLISSFMFTALHAMDQTPVALVVVGLLSITFSMLTIWRRSIIPAIVTHALFDFSQFFGIYYLMGDA